MAVIDVDDAPIVTRIDCARGCVSNAPGDLSGLLASFVRNQPSSLLNAYRGAATQYDITVSGGMVTGIDERYLP